VNNATSIDDVSAQASGKTVADTTKPVVSITTPSNLASVSHGKIVVKGTASDDPGGSGVKTVAVEVDSGSFVTATPSAPGNWSTWSITVNIPRSGSHTLTARATDNAGNIGTNKITITVT
jgi:hypothetical protein